MGGFGSGREAGSHQGRLVAENCQQLDISHWNRSGCCKPGSDTAIALYKFADGTQVARTQSITWTPCNYGGQRPWFVCPKCQQRSGKLFRFAISRFAATSFQCRKCLNLTYRRSNVSGNHYDEFSHRCRRIGRKLKGQNFCRLSTGYLFPPSRPKGMHWKTYERLTDKLLEYDLKFISHSNAWFERVAKRLGYDHGE